MEYENEITNHWKHVSESLSGILIGVGIEYQIQVSLNNFTFDAAVRQFTCELCGISYLQQGGLTNHLITAHSETRPWKCDICGLG